MQETPHCFGMIVTHSPESRICKPCDHINDCSAVVIETLELLGEQIDVSDLLHAVNRDSRMSPPKEDDKTNLELVIGIKRRTKVATRFEITEEQERVIEFIKARYKKAERLVRSMFKNGIDVRWSLLNRENPFYSIDSHKYMRIVCDKLLSDGFTRAELKRAFMAKHDWSNGTANSHVLAVTHTLSALNVTTEDQRGRFLLKEAA